MKDKTIYVLHANICKILANPIRIELIEILGEKEINFTDLQIATGVLKSNLSQHLSLMVNNGILSQRREGKKAFYKLSSKKTALACSIMREILVENLNKQHEIIKQL
jgi:DNA-binding transcriptional ArsR family regulator